MGCVWARLRLAQTASDGTANSSYESTCCVTQWDNHPTWWAYVLCQAEGHHHTDLQYDHGCPTVWHSTYHQSTTVVTWDWETGDGVWCVTLWDTHLLSWDTCCGTLWDNHLLLWSYMLCHTVEQPPDPMSLYTVPMQLVVNLVLVIWVVVVLICELWAFWKGNLLCVSGLCLGEPHSEWWDN